jgi:hypothetical protein
MPLWGWEEGVEKVSLRRGSNIRTLDGVHMFQWSYHWMVGQVSFHTPTIVALANLHMESGEQRGTEAYRLCQGVGARPVYHPFTDGHCDSHPRKGRTVSTQVSYLNRMWASADGVRDVGTVCIHTLHYLGGQGREMRFTC